MIKKTVLKILFWFILVIILVHNHLELLSIIPLWFYVLELYKLVELT